jgi:two-component system KDP operon response regulator KdpE
MPRLNGLGLIAAIRGLNQTPIIAICERDRDRIRALGLGADDAVARPFSFNELLRRVRAQLRRLGTDGPAVLTFHGLRIEREQRRVRQGEGLERDVRLTPMEFAILEMLALSAGRAVPNAHIAAYVWKGASPPTPDTVRVHVGSLRRKIEPDPARPRYVITEPWVGYRFVAEPI